MFDMEFADLEPLMGTDDVTDADFIDISDSLGGDSGQAYRDLQHDAQQLMLLTSTAEQCDQSANAIIDYRPPTPIPTTKKVATTKNQGCKQQGYHRPASRNAARERSRVKSLRCAFLDLQNSLPSVPPNTKLSKLDVLVLATTYIAHLMKVLDKPGLVTTNDDHDQSSLRHQSTSSDAVRSYHSSITTTNMMPAPINPNHLAKMPTKASGVGRQRHQHRLHEKGYLHPVRKWPMRSRLYAGAIDENSAGSQLQLPTFVAPPSIDYLNFDMILPTASQN